MRARPRIGIPTQTLEAIPDQLPLCWVMGQHYVRALVACGAVPWVIPLLPGDTATLRLIYDQLDGVFLTGGVDVDPSLYQEPRHPLCGKTDPARDWTELELVRWACRDHKPILGVCRGIQLLNVAAGGSLYQDLQAELPAGIKHDCFPYNGKYTRDQLVHEVEISSGSRLAGILQSERLQVNSMHHQGIKRLAPGLIATAHAPDGLIEGIEGSNGQYLVGVQWHPEELTRSSAAMTRLFSSFLDAALAYGYHHSETPLASPS